MTHNRPELRKRLKQVRAKIVRLKQDEQCILDQLKAIDHSAKQTKRRNMGRDAEIHRRHSEGETLTSLAAEFGISSTRAASIYHIMAERAAVTTIEPDIDWRDLPIQKFKLYCTGGSRIVSALSWWGVNTIGEAVDAIERGYLDLDRIPNFGSKSKRQLLEWINGRISNWAGPKSRT